LKPTAWTKRELTTQPLAARISVTPVTGQLPAVERIAVNGCEPCLG
jgi:hypothetical protein